MELEKRLGLLRTLRDEVGMGCTLVVLEAKDEWKKLEPELHRVEDAEHELSETTRAAAADALKRLTKLRSSLS